MKHASSNKWIGGAMALGMAAGGVGALLGTAPAAEGATRAPTVLIVEHNATWGPILALANHDTVYRLTADRRNKSVCTGACATYWPPVLLAPGQKAPIGRGLKGLGSIPRSGGVRQVTYDGIPLYRFVGDARPGEVNGNIANSFGRWWAVNPTHPFTPPTRRASGATTTTAGGGY